MQAQTLPKGVRAPHLKDDWLRNIALLANRLHRHLRKTPLVRSDYYSQKFGCNLYLKLENLQHTGSFKARGALAKAITLTEKRRRKGFVAASAGNHGLGVCYAARIFGVGASIFLPKTTPAYKIRKIVELGGHPIVNGSAWHESNEAALSFAKKKESIYFHPFDDEHVIDGQATIAQEIYEDVPDTDVLICSVGGGGLLSGLSRYAKTQHPKARVYGVETLGADSMYQSWQKGCVHQLPGVTSVAESIAVREPAQRTFDYVRQYADGLCVVEDDEALHAQAVLLQQEKILAEPAMTCCLAMLEKNMVPNLKGKNVVVVVCGGNYPVEKLAQTLRNDPAISYKVTKDALRRQLAEFGIPTHKKASAFNALFEEVKKRELAGYTYTEAPASLELFVRQAFGTLPRYFELMSYRIVEEHHNGLGRPASDLSEATVKLRLAKKLYMEVAEGENGPVHALDTVLRKALTPHYPALQAVRLTDYKVRILNPHEASRASTRVVIESRDDLGREWKTIGISADILGASYEALYQSFLYKLVKDQIAPCANVKQNG